MSGLVKESLLTVLLLGNIAVYAQPLPEPLVNAVKTAILSSPDVQEKWKAFKGSSYLPVMARSQWLPKANLTGTLGVQDGENAGQRYGWNDTQTSELTLSQLLFDGGIASSAIRGAEGERLKSYYAMTEASEAVALEVVKAYADVLRYREVVDAATENYAEHKRTTDMLDERVRATVGRRVDLEQGNARLAKAEAALVTETISLHNAGARYLRMVGTVPPSRLPDWPEDMSLAKLPATAQETLQKGLVTSPTLQVALQSWRNAEEIVVGKSKTVYMPRIEARASVSRSGNLDGVLGNAGKQVAEVVLQQNIYRGGYDRATQVSAEEASKRARAQLEQACREVRQTMSVAYKDVYIFNQQLGLLDQHRLSADKTRTAYRQQFDIGQRTLLDLLDTQNEWFDASRQYTNMRFDQLIAQARTMASMGQLVAALGAGRADWPTATDAGQDAGQSDPGVYCPVETVPMDIAVPTLPKRPSYVVLLPNADGTVGAVVVKGPDGEQVISKAQYGAPINAQQAATEVQTSDVEKDFGAALKAQPVLPEKFTLFFERGSTRLSKSSQADWNTMLTRMKARATLDITVAGYADTVSSSQINDALALKRAQFVAQKLRASGFKDVEIGVEGFGKRSLAVPTPDETDEPRNRRAVVIVR